MTTAEIKLPNAVQTAKGTWTKDVELDEMTGAEEDILVDMTRAPGGQGALAKPGPKRITEILSRCTCRIGDETRPAGKDRFSQPDYFKPHWAKAKSNDRIAALIRIRQITLGDAYIFAESCPSCRKEIKRCNVNLAELAETTTTVEFASKETHDIVLPKCKDRITWRFINGEADELEIENIVQTNKSEFLSALLFLRIVQVNGGTDFGGLNYIKRLNALDRRFLALHFDISEGGVETDIKITCDGCGTEFSKKLAVMGRTDFFFPSEILSPESSISVLLQKPGDGAPKLSTGSPSLEGNA